MKEVRVVQTDGRGQLVIPKNIREELEIKDGSAFWIHAINDNEIVLKKIKPPKIKKRR